MKVGFIGLSHLGLCYLAASAEKKCNVIGYTKNRETFKQLSQFKISIKEPHLIETIRKKENNNTKK